MIILSLLRVYTALHSLGTLSVSLQQSPLISSDYVILICAEHDAPGQARVSNFACKNKLLYLSRGPIEIVRPSGFSFFHVNTVKFFLIKSLVTIFSFLYDIQIKIFWFVTVVNDECTFKNRQVSENAEYGSCIG